ncbi:MAG: HNH endonuclease [Bacteroidetes bacterium]|nr:HNH endonuclease [Bacteroidota bacterium]
MPLPHWSGKDKLVPRAFVEFETLFDPDKMILPIELLKIGELGNQNWSTQRSGIKIRPELVDDLEALWFDFLKENAQNDFLNDSTINDTTFYEGSKTQITTTRYERNPYARKKCIEHYGLNCSVCEFNFEKTYGKVGADFIHVHHLNQISDVGQSYIIDPIKDLCTVCPNCHAMIHKRKIPYSIEEMKNLLLIKAE